MAKMYWKMTRGLKQLRSFDVLLICVSFFFSYLKAQVSTRRSITIQPGREAQMAMITQISLGHLQRCQDSHPFISETTNILHEIYEPERLYSTLDFTFGPACSPLGTFLNESTSNSLSFSFSSSGLR